MLTQFAGVGFAIIVGFSLGVFSRTKAACENVVSACCAGLLFGLLIGLCASPIVGTVLSGAITLVGVVIPMFGAKSGESQARQAVTFLGPFAIVATIGVLGGIALRLNDVLYFGPRTLLARYEAAGFSKEQIATVLQRFADSKEPPVELLAIPAVGSKDNLYLLSGGNSGMTLSTLAKLPCDQCIPTARDSQDATLRKLVKAMEKQNEDASEICALLAEMAKQ